MSQRRANLLRAGERYCRVCTCTNEEPCCDEGGEPCAWVEPNLCSSCQDAIERCSANPDAEKQLREACDREWERVP